MKCNENENTPLILPPPLYFSFKNIKIILNVPTIQSTPISALANIEIIMPPCPQNLCGDIHGAHSPNQTSASISNIQNLRIQFQALADRNEYLEKKVERLQRQNKSLDSENTRILYENHILREFNARLLAE